ncbi:peptidylprolyl isomerase [Aquirufa aurantiipilula]|uniref:Periplasmic chaperone PpiD n=1 Tax=Aquirufa aurantiipilula TaxID=2696561 RepID=A0ABT6BN18_9BACT|nr:peptidylprolyl isomerase [Aquirufa aurantiipilula]MBZ1325751.1 peptidylprolyl isomerase [Aquirufa aurantiipilula]MDF5691349.1 SurA N-terminal domain-containing protein [Aquirufa aurantiipilula]
MALITKIREKSGIAAAAIAISLILFLIGSDIFQGRSSLFGSNNQEVGVIAGESILLPEFQKKVEEATANYTAQTGKGPGEQEATMIRDQVWNQYILDIAYKKEFDALGLKVSSEELIDMVQGNNIHPSVRQQFTNPQTGQFDKTFVIQFLKNLKTMPAQQQQGWANFEKSIAQDRIRSKYENLIRLSTYVNTAEAQKEYQAQNAKFSARFLYVPFFSIPDSTVKVTDAQLEEYLAKHKDRFKGVNSRSIQYATFPVVPTAQDTVEFYNQIKKLAKDLAVAPNDSAFAMLNSDVRTPYLLAYSEIPEVVKSQLGTFQVGGIYGPFKNGLTYSIYKYGGVKKDSLFTVRASHILIAPANKSDSAKAQAKQRAESILTQIKGGASFETLAQLNGMDGTAQNGGDLGYFKNNGSMTKAFEKAIFGFNGAGLMPGVVETEFGYHIVKITDAKTNTAYRLAAINKTIAPSQATLDRVYTQADAFANANGTLGAFEAALKKDKNIIMMRAERLLENATSINNLTNAREIVRWAFDEGTSVGDGSKKVFEQDNQYIVAYLTGKTDKDNVKVDDYREGITNLVRAELKGEKISAKLSGIKGSLEQIAQKYGAGALVENVADVTLSTGMLNTAGPDAVALGKIAGLKTGKRSQVFIGDNGVFIAEKTAAVAAPALADYTTYKTQIQSMGIQRASYYINEAIKDNAKIVDKRYKFY